MHSTANNAKVAGEPIALMIDRNVAPTMKQNTQLNAVATAIALPRIRFGKISEISVQTTGPSENANEAMYTILAMSVTMPVTPGPPTGARLREARR